jgi:hypothetical protein
LWWSSDRIRPEPPLGRLNLHQGWHDDLQARGAPPLINPTFDPSNPTAPFNVTLNGFTIQNGRAFDATGTSNAPFASGGVLLDFIMNRNGLESATATLNGDTLRGNTSTEGAREGQERHRDAAASDCPHPPGATKELHSTPLTPGPSKRRVSGSFPSGNRTRTAGTTHGWPGKGQWDSCRGVTVAAVPAWK